MSNEPTVTEMDLSTVDWSRHSFELGVAREDSMEQPPSWNEMQLEDWEVLEKLLTKQLAPGVPSAAESSEALARLAHAAKSIRTWMEKRDERRQRRLYHLSGGSER